MEVVSLIFSIVQVILCIGIVVLVLFQSGNSQGLSGSIAGGAETFLGKNKARSLDAKLSKLTVIAAIIFAITTMALNVL